MVQELGFVLGFGDVPIALDSIAAVYPNAVPNGLGSLSRVRRGAKCGLATVFTPRIYMLVECV